MLTGLCHPGTWESLGNTGLQGWIGLILILVFWVGLLAGLTLLTFRVMKRARVPVTTDQPSAKEILQVQYARGEITREEYEPRKQELDNSKE